MEKVINMRLTQLPGPDRWPAFSIPSYRIGMQSDFTVPSKPSLCRTIAMSAEALGADISPRCPLAFDCKPGGCPVLHPSFGPKPKERWYHAPVWHRSPEEFGCGPTRLAGALPLPNNPPARGRVNYTQPFNTRHGGVPATPTLWAGRLSHHFRPVRLGGFLAAT